MFKKLLGITSFVLAGCATKTTHVVLDSVEVFSKASEVLEENRKEIDGLKVLLIADNQKALVTSEPILEQGNIVEKIANTAHRKPALDAFSLDIVNYMANRDEFGLILHGGDILNNSCSWEFKQVEKSLNSTGLPWFVAPGNHDGYYLGITSPISISKRIFWPGNGPLDERAGWAQSCVDVKTKIDEFGRRSFDKYEDYQTHVADKIAYIGLYLDAIGVNAAIKSLDIEVDSEDISQNSGFAGYSVKCVDFEESANGLHKGYMSNVCWTKHENNDDFLNALRDDKIKEGWTSVSSDEDSQWEERFPWRNFLVQKLKVNFGNSPVDIIIVDTASYSPNHALKPSGWMIDVKSYGAADNAHISEPQWKIIKDLVTPEKETIILGHHPLVDFDIDSYQRIQKLFTGYKAVRYISGDTHNGYEVKFREKNSDSDFVVRETNLGSTIDAPLEYAVAGYSDGELLTKRYSLTPMKNLKATSGASEFKRSKKPATSKHYAEFDDALWTGVCATKFGKYQSTDLESDPFNTGDYLSPLSSYVLENVNLVKAWLNGSSGFYIEMYVYKINRLIALSEIYSKLYAYAEVEKPAMIVAKEKTLEATLAKLKSKNHDYLDGISKDDWYWGMEELTKLVLMYERDLPSNEKAQEFKLCSAIYEAENEYRADSL